MKSLTRWPVTVSYYDRDAKPTEGEQTPVYAMSFELFENGVSRALVLDYNDFVDLRRDGQIRRQGFQAVSESAQRARAKVARLLDARAARRPVAHSHRRYPLLRPLIGNAPDHGGVAEFLAQIVHRAFGMGRAAVEHVGVVGLRARPQRADAGAHQPESGAVDFLCQHLAGDRENLRRELGRRVDRLRAGALPEIGGLQFQRDGQARRARRS